MTSRDPEAPVAEQEGSVTSRAPSGAIEHASTEVHQNLRDDTKEVIRRLTDRRALMDAAILTERLSEGAGVVLQARVADFESGDGKKSAEIVATRKSTPKDVTEAVNYRLAITDLFVEKAQYHLESRANRYEYLGILMYLAAVLLFGFGACIAVGRMLDHDSHPPSGLPSQAQTAPTISAYPTAIPVSMQSASAAPTQSSAASSTQPPPAGSAQSAAIPPPPLPVAAPYESPFAPAAAPAQDATQAWIELLRRFMLAFTAYGLIVLTAVALARGGRACLDQRERLLAKRHSLRQGRLFLHLTGGHVTIEDMERAFNWNHEQHNAFTHMPTDAKAPWGGVVEELVKITPELVKAGVSATRDSTDKKDGKDPKGT